MIVRRPGRCHRFARRRVGRTDRAVRDRRLARTRRTMRVRVPMRLMRPRIGEMCRHPPLKRLGLSLEAVEHVDLDVKGCTGRRTRRWATATRREIVRVHAERGLRLRGPQWDRHQRDERHRPRPAAASAPNPPRTSNHDPAPPACHAPNVRGVDHPELRSGGPSQTPRPPRISGKQSRRPRGPDTGQFASSNPNHAPIRNDRACTPWTV